jgi:hypothetical protein
MFLSPSGERLGEGMQPTADSWITPSLSLSPKGRAIAYGYSRRLDRGPKARVERPSLNDRPLIVERRSLRSALRAPVETTEGERELTA